MISSTLPARRVVEVLTEAEVDEIIAKVFAFCQEATGVELHDYERAFGRRIVESLLLNDGEEITGLFARQSGKCLAVGTKVLRFDGSSVRVEDVSVGDLLMGPDSRPREVTSTCCGREELYEVRPRNKYHEPYVVNRSHILTVWNRRKLRLEDKPLQELLEMAPGQESYSGAKVAVEYPGVELAVDPYWLGLWVGDDNSRGVRITTGDREIVEYLTRYAEELGMGLSEYSERSNCSSYAITRDDIGGQVKNPLRSFLQGARLLQNKHVPRCVLVNDRATRLSFLAGLIDADGHRPRAKGQSTGCELIFKQRVLSQGVVALSRSLGFRASLRPKVIQGTVYWRVMLYGELWQVPTLIERKQYQEVRLRENPRTYGFDLVSKGPGEYAGFTLGGDGRFLLSDYTVTHNTETVAVIVVGCMVILPTLARMCDASGAPVSLAEDPRIAKFRNGLWVGIFSPTYGQSSIMHQRMAARMASSSMRTVMAEPELGLAPKEGRKVLDLENGSYVDCNSAAVGTMIEGRTYHLLVLEESQDIDDYKVEKEIHPMGASTNATVIKIGTPNTKRGNFYETCKRNRARDLDGGVGHRRCHYQYDYTFAARCNPNYAKYIEKEIVRLGYDSDSFRMAYRLHWILERGLFVAPELLDECGIRSRDRLKTKVSGRLVYFDRPDYPGNQDRTTVGQVAAVDVGRAQDSTVVTVARVWWDNPIDVAGESRYYTHVMNWLELVGDDYELQYPQILSFLGNFNLGLVVVDATGAGDPVFSRIRAELAADEATHGDVHVTPFVMTPKSKHLGYQLLQQEMHHKRFTYPAGKGARKQQKWRHFVQQMAYLEKEWKGRYMSVKAPTGRKGSRDRKAAHDDFPDSAMMVCWAVNGGRGHGIEEADNIMLGRSEVRTVFDLARSIANERRRERRSGAARGGRRRRRRR